MAKASSKDKHDFFIGKRKSNFNDFCCRNRTCVKGYGTLFLSHFILEGIVLEYENKIVREKR